MIICRCYCLKNSINKIIQLFLGVERALTFCFFISLKKLKGNNILKYYVELHYLVESIANIWKRLKAIR